MMPPIDDIDKIMAVMSTAFDPAYGEAWNRRQVEDALLIGNCHYGLVSTGPSCAGFYLSRYGVEEEELLLLAVCPEHRHQGWGRKLLAQFTQQAKAELERLRDGGMRQPRRQPPFVEKHRDELLALLQPRQHPDRKSVV